MEIQNIPGFKLPATTITSSPSYYHFTRGRGGGIGTKRWRPPAELKTLDFSVGLEAYIPPRVLTKRPNSTRQRQRSKANSSQDKEIQFDIEEAGNASSTPKTTHQVDGLLKVNESKETHSEISSFIALDKEKDKDFLTTANKSYQEWNSDVVHPNNVDVGQSICVAEIEKKDERPHELYLSPSPKVTFDSASSTYGLEIKFHEQQSREVELLPSPQKWFEKTLQQYEDLRKSVDAQMSSSPSSINESVDVIATNAKDDYRSAIWVQPSRGDPQLCEKTGTNGLEISHINFKASDARPKRMAQLLNLHSEIITSHLEAKHEVLKPTNMLGEERPLWERPEHVTGQYLIHGMSPILSNNSPLEEAKKKQETKFEKRKSRNLIRYSCGCSPKQVLPTNFPIYSCGCSPKKEIYKATRHEFPSCQCQQRALLTTNEATQDNMAWKQLVDTITQLRKVNKGLQSTIEELSKPEGKLDLTCNKGLTSILVDWRSLTKENISSIGLCKPEVRKQLLSSLRSSVKKMQSLMQALKEEQEKSEILSGKLNDFLTAKSEQGLLLLGPTPIGSRATSPCHDVHLLLPLSPKPIYARESQDTRHEAFFKIDPEMVSLGVNLTSATPSQPSQEIGYPQHIISNKAENDDSQPRLFTPQLISNDKNNNSQLSKPTEAPMLTDENSQNKKNSRETSQLRESFPSMKEKNNHQPSQPRESYRFVISNMEKNRLEASHRKVSIPFIVSNKDKNISPHPLYQDSSQFTTSNKDKNTSQPSRRRESYRLVVSSIDKNSYQAAQSQKLSHNVLLNKRTSISRPSSSQESPQLVISNEKNRAPTSPRVRKPSQVGVVYSI